MARHRDYAAEYARRIEREREAAEREGREFSRAQARGHLSPAYEAAQRRERKLGPVAPRTLEYWTRRTAFGIPLDEYRGIVDEAVERLSGGEGDDSSEGGDGRATRWMVARLRTKYADTLDFLSKVAEGMTYKEAAESGPGQGHYFTGRIEYVGVEVYWYHGSR